MKYDALINSLHNIDPIAYSKSRNYTHGAITRLSPYIARGILDTKTILENIANRGFSFYQAEKFIQQLAWRDYFQRVWQLKGDAINTDLKNPQDAKFKEGLPLAISDASTGIESIDQSIKQLQHSGYIHNHVRMYVAFLACNLTGFHWRDPARWMYYYLLDGDWGSNALSWQWVAGNFSNKKYIANQENINHYTKSNQQGTYLDCSYEDLAKVEPPDHLLTCDLTTLQTKLPSSSALVVDNSLPTFIYNYYNLSPTWRSTEEGNRILLLEPTLFEIYPISNHCVDFLMSAAKEIPGIQTYVGSFSSLKKLLGNSILYFREHPLNSHYIGNQDDRSWLIEIHEPVKDSFFSFWNKYNKKIRKIFFE